MEYKAFVSSTFEDLKEHRAVVIRALRKAGIQVDPMEEWTAASQEPREFSQRRVDGCHLCVLLVGFRRGHVPEGGTSSITQLEYEAAQRAGMTILVFMLAEDSLWLRRFDDMDKDPELKKWRSQLKEHHGIETFSYEPESIEIAPALTRWIAETARARDDQVEDLVYDSNRGETSLEGWTYYSSTGIGSENFSRESDATFGGRVTITMRAHAFQEVGINLSLRTLAGRARLTYRVARTNLVGTHLYIAFIPMEETGFGRSGLIEAGATVQDDPRNPISFFRQRFVIPEAHQRDGEWHTADFAFDLRNVPNAFYSILAPRINEGCPQPADAELRIATALVYSSERTA
jgi:hypothetical protein